MAFPFDSTHLLVHLRASYLVLENSEKQSTGVIKPIDVHNNSIKVTKDSNVNDSDSPPITFQIARHVQKSLQSHNQNNSFKNKDRAGPRTKRHEKRKKTSLPERNHQRTTSVDTLDNDIDLKHPMSTQSDYNFDDSRAESLYQEPVDASSVAENAEEPQRNQLTYSSTIRGKSKDKYKPITRFFQSKGKDSTDAQSDRDSESDGSIKTSTLKPSADQSLDLIEEEINNDDTEDGDITETEEKRRSKRKSKQKMENSDLVSIDSDFGVPVDANGQVVRNWNGNFLADTSMEPQDANDRVVLEDDEEQELIEDEEDEDFSDEYDFESFDASSTDSAFTDIETDSILESSILSNSFDPSTSNSYSFNNPTIGNSFKVDKRNRKKKRDGSFDQHSLSKVSATTNFKAVPSQASIYGKTQSPSFIKSISNYKKPSVSFEKHEVNTTSSGPSKLSSMIQSRFKSINVNPLAYYSFAEMSTLSETVDLVKVSVFVPPNNKPSLSDLRVNKSVVIVDCIGLILLTLSKLPGFKASAGDLTYLNPNHWRLELVDEDGENYGSFGILDRSRDLSSYNNPKEIALCKVNDPEEIKRNDKQTPLPVEVKSNLLAYERKQETEILAKESKKVGSTVPGYDDNVELKILNVPTRSSQTSMISFNVDRSATIGQVIKEFCTVQGLSFKFRFKEVIPVSKSSMIPSDINPKEGNFLSLDEKIDSLSHLTVMLVPSNIPISQFQESANSMAMQNITPTDSSFPTITPDKKQLEDRFDPLTLKKLNLDDMSAKPSKQWRDTKVRLQARPNTAASTKSQINSNKYLDDIMKGKNPSLPTNLNTIYYKWKVYRKKTTILNKIEKSLVLDGDYIHLTPSDDIVFKKNPGENPFINQPEATHNNHSHHHHHHIHYYNYNNYYKESMMKTSSFHITQIVKMKQYKNSKNPNHFKIVIQKSSDNSKEPIKKKYDLEALSVEECEEIISKLKWVIQVYSMI